MMFIDCFRQVFRPVKQRIQPVLVDYVHSFPKLSKKSKARSSVVLKPFLVIGHGRSVSLNFTHHFVWHIFILVLYGLQWQSSMWWFLDQGYLDCLSCSLLVRCSLTSDRPVITFILQDFHHCLLIRLGMWSARSFKQGTIHPWTFSTSTLPVHFVCRRNHGFVDSAPNVSSTILNTTADSSRTISLSSNSQYDLFISLCDSVTSMWSVDFSCSIQQLHHARLLSRCRHKLWKRCLVGYWMGYIELGWQHFSLSHASANARFDWHCLQGEIRNQLGPRYASLCWCRWCWQRHLPRWLWWSIGRQTIERFLVLGWLDILGKWRVMDYMMKMWMMLFIDRVMAVVMVVCTHEHQLSVTGLKASQE